VRLGFIVPSVNVVLEDDLRRFLPDDVSAHVTRIALTGTTEDALKAALQASAPAARLLAHAGVDAMALACTGASIVGGQKGGPGSELREASGVPGLDTMQALTAAFEALGARRILLFSPFDDAFNATEAASLSARGFEVVRTVGLGIRDPRRCPEISLDDIVERVVQADLPSVDVVFLSCANLRGFEAVAALEERLSKPVVTTNQAVIWALLRMAGSAQDVAGGGRLFTLTGGMSG
jgi:maleate isomerase